MEQRGARVRDDGYVVTLAGEGEAWRLSGADLVPAGEYTARSPKKPSLPGSELQRIHINLWRSLAGLIH